MDKLDSSQSTKYHPYIEDDRQFVDDDRPHKERARRTSVTAPQIYVNRDANKVILSTSAGARELDMLARTQKDIAVALRTVETAAFWVPGTLISQNDYEKNPDFEHIDNVIINDFNEIFAKMKYQSFEQSLIDMLHTSRVCGFSVTEKVWEKDEFGLPVLRALKGQKPWDFDAVVDEWNNLVAVYHKPTSSYFHQEAFIWGVWRYLHGGNYLGQSELEPIRHDLNMVDQLEKAIIVNSAMSAKSIILHNYSDQMRDLGQIRQTNEELNNAFTSSDVNVVHIPSESKPDGTLTEMDKFTTINSLGNPASLQMLWQIISETRKDIKRVLGLPDDLGNTTTPNGSWAKASEVMNIFVARAEECQRWVADIINRDLICSLIKYRYPDLDANYRYPQWSYQPIEETFQSDKANFITMMLDKGILKLDDPEHAMYIAKVLNLPDIQSD